MNHFMNIAITADIHLALVLDYRVYLTDPRGQREFGPYPGDTLGPSSKKRPLMEAEALVSTPLFFMWAIQAFMEIIKLGQMDIGVRLRH